MTCIFDNPETSCRELYRGGECLLSIPSSWVLSRYIPQFGYIDGGDWVPYNVVGDYSSLPPAIKALRRDLAPPPISLRRSKTLFIPSGPRQALPDYGRSTLDAPGWTGRKPFLDELDLDFG